ncbi:acetate--CoA ligase family protein [Nonomuraea typhae]|uniref:Acetate--CoA ligase family protein n=1 Tax=Nonomuraea typhae TaxID=2603600 RepID=A0ABW7ZD58_9ACTN
MFDLRPLLEPRSVAVVGASDRPGSYADTVLRNLERAGFPGPVWGVNPRRAEVHGRPCVARLAELPEPVDAVVVAIPAPGVPDVVAEAGELGCGGAIVLSAGFGEVASGRDLENRLRAAALAHHLPVCGPNGNGIVAVRARAPLWGDSVPPLEPGAVAMITQSGNVGVNALGTRRAIAWHTVISTGNQTVCEAADWLDVLAGTDGVRSIAMFLESDGDGVRLAEALARCADTGVRVAVLKVGSSTAGSAAAAAHTGSLAGDSRVFRALIQEAGGAWAQDPHELLELARVLAAPRARTRGGLAVLTCSGGDSGLAADAAERVGVELPELGPATGDKLRVLLPETATIGNPLDYTTLIWGDDKILAEVIATVGDDPAVGQLLLCHDRPHGLSAHAEAELAAVRAGIAAGAERSRAATLVASTLPDLIDVQLETPVVAGLSTALTCIRALQAPLGNAERLHQIATAAGRARPTAHQDGRWLAEAATKQLLRDAGIAVPDGRIITSEEECLAAAHILGYPLVLKVSDPRLLHKSEAGAVALGLNDEPALRAAWARLIASPAATRRTLLLERMAEPGVELIVAARADAVVPALVVGVGGIWTEALDDVAIIPLPAPPARIERALRSLRGAGALTGARGRDPVDLIALANLTARAGELLLERRLTLLELNPVIARPNGVTAVDALAKAVGAQE